MCYLYDINENTTCCAPVCSNVSCDLQCPFGMHLLSSQMYPETCNSSNNVNNTIIKNLCVWSCPKEFIRITIVNTSFCLGCDTFCVINFGSRQLPSNCICPEVTLLTTPLIETTELSPQMTPILYANTVLTSSALSLTEIIVYGSAALAVFVAIVSVFCCCRWRYKFYRLQKTIQVPNRNKLSTTSSSRDHAMEDGNTYTAILVDSQNSEPVNIDTTTEDISTYASIPDEIKGTENLQNVANGASGSTVEENKYEELPCRVKTKETQFTQSIQNEYVRTKTKGRQNQQSRKPPKITTEDNKYMSVHGLKRQEAQEVVQGNSNTLQVPRNEYHLSTAKYESMHVGDTINKTKPPDIAKGQEKGSNFVQPVPQSNNRIHSNSTDEEKRNIISKKAGINPADVYETMANVKPIVQTTDQSASRLVTDAEPNNLEADGDPYMHSNSVEKRNIHEDMYSINCLPLKKKTSNLVSNNIPNRNIENHKDQMSDAFGNTNITGNKMSEEQIYVNTDIFRKPTCSKTDTKSESSIPTNNKQESINDNLINQNKDKKEITMRSLSNGENVPEVTTTVAVGEWRSDEKSNAVVRKVVSVAGCQSDGEKESGNLQATAIAGCHSFGRSESENSEVADQAGFQINEEMEQEDFKTTETRLNHSASFQSKLGQRLEQLNKNGDHISSDEETF
ncbi:Hypothetical predicted protein [Mytilus galloprovincialis]|uniref:Uncharacterized protein n=2 Tax=Mytilus galloprovincialis TaxID=29158 RepID=A0A8B6G1N0_MYTGA|nr:Hypothetical predicted protein [Mytilus galloprovincialis]